MNIIHFCKVQRFITLSPCYCRKGLNCTNAPPPPLQSAVCSTIYYFKQLCWLFYFQDSSSITVPALESCFYPLTGIRINLFSSFSGVHQRCPRRLTHNSIWEQVSCYLHSWRVVAPLFVSHRFILVRHTHQSTHAAQVIALPQSLGFVLLSSSNPHFSTTCARHTAVHKTLYSNSYPPPPIPLSLVDSVVCGVPKYSPLRCTGRRTGQWPLTFLGWFCCSITPPCPCLWRRSCLCEILHDWLKPVLSRSACFGT